MIMIVKTPGSHVGSPAIAEGGREVRGVGRWREKWIAIEVDVEVK